MTSIDKRLERAFERIKASCHVDDLSLACFRIFFAWYILLFDAPFFQWMAGVPQGFFSPPVLSIANFFDGFLSPFWFYVGDTLTLLLLGCLALGIRARLTGFLISILVIFFSGFQYGFGKIDHEILVWMTLLLLSFTNWGTRLALIPDKPLSADKQNTALGLVGIFLAFGLFTAGFEKAFNWVDFDLGTSGFLRWFYNGYFNLGRQSLLMPYVFSLPMVMVEIGDYLAVMFEVSGFYFLIRSPRSWRLWMLTACIFHLANTLVLNISFYIHVAVYGLFLLSPVLQLGYQTVSVHVQKTKRRLILILGTTLLVTSHLLQRSLSEGSRYLFIEDYVLELQIDLLVSLIVWSLMIVSGVRTLKLQTAKTKTPQLKEVPVEAYQQSG